MSKQALLGNFVVSTSVVSQNQETAVIRKSTPDPTHVIQIENTSTVPRDARVRGYLPDGTSHLTFDDAGTKSADWLRDVGTMIVNEVRRRNCLLQYVSASSGQVPVRCEEVWTKRGSGKWTPESGNLPLGVSVDVR